MLRIARNGKYPPVCGRLVIKYLIIHLKAVSDPLLSLEKII